MIQIYYNNVGKINIKQALVKKWLKALFDRENFYIGDVSYIFCSDEYLLSINMKYLNHNTYTDIITFDYSSDSPVQATSGIKKNDKLILGDIFISIDRVKENADKFKVSFKNELFRVMAHGILHLMGYKDKTTKDIKIQATS